MLLLLKLAFRNIFRNFRRSLLTFLSISIGIGLSIIIVGILIGTEKQSIRLLISTRIGHAQVYSAGYIEEELTLPLDYTISGYETLVDELLTIPAVQTAAERILFPATLTDGIDELRLTGAGIDAMRENVTFHLADRIVDGTYIAPGEEKILLGDVVAELFGKRIGDPMTIIARTKYGAITALDVEIAGLFNVGNPEIDNNYFFLPLDIAQTILEMENEITEVTLFGNSMEEADALETYLNGRFDTNIYDIVSWKYSSRDLLKLYSMKSKGTQVIYLILFIMISASIMNTMLMSVYERTREIGTLMSLGFRRRNILSLFALEGGFLGAFGGVIGTIIGGAITYYLKIYGLNIEFMIKSGFGDFPIGSRIYAEINPSSLFYFILIGVSIALLSAVYPSWKGARMEPTEALRAV